MFNKNKFNKNQSQDQSKDENGNGQKKNIPNKYRRQTKPNSNGNNIDNYYEKDGNSGGDKRDRPFNRKDRRDRRFNRDGRNNHDNRKSDDKSTKSNTGDSSESFSKINNDANSWANRLNQKTVDIQLKANEKNEDGRHIKLRNTYVLWCHDIYNKNWNISSYKKLMIIDTVADFWKLFNNFHKLGMRFNHYFLMKDYTEPTWEHISNRDGGICSFKIELNDSPTVWHDLNIKMICGALCEQLDDINGISISPKNNWAIIKIWNKSKENDLSTALHQEILDKYKELTIRYQQNTPEY